MRAYMESGFYLAYLVIMAVTGFRILLKAERRENALFGVACLVLGFGDAFHLVPRAAGLFSGTLDAPGKTLSAWLGVGKLITSITMTVFYVLLYFFIHSYAGKKRSRALDILVWVLFAARIILCAFPQNGWISNSSPLIWGIIRNVPFVLLGILVIVLSFRLLRADPGFSRLWLFIILSFAFYIPVVLWAATYRWTGMLMLPKTICYVCIALMGVRRRKP